MLKAFLNAFRVPDLRAKILFTLAIIAVFRLGSYMPVPVVDIGILQRELERQGAGELAGALEHELVRAPERRRPLVRGQRGPAREGRVRGRNGGADVRAAGLHDLAHEGPSGGIRNLHAVRSVAPASADVQAARGFDRTVRDDAELRHRRRIMGTAQHRCQGALLLDCVPGRCVDTCLPSWDNRET